MSEQILKMTDERPGGSLWRVAGLPAEGIAVEVAR
jgi:hypothetical protein